MAPNTRCYWHHDQTHPCPKCAEAAPPALISGEEKRGISYADRLKTPAMTRAESLAYVTSFAPQAADSREATQIVRAVKVVQDGLEAARESKSAAEYWNRILSTTVWTEPQRELISAVRNQSLKTVIAYGPIACGKTLALTASLVGLVLQQGETDSSVVHGVITRARQQASVTVYTNLVRWAWDAWTNVEAKEDGWLLGGHRIVRSVGAHELSAHQIQGGDWGGVLVNEGTIMPISMIDQAAERSRVGMGKVLVDTNPDTPDNEFEQRYVAAIEAGERSGKVVRFSLVDEESWNEETGSYDSSPCWWLPPNYIGDICRMYPQGSPEHDRRILGKPAYHAGMVFPSTGQALLEWDGSEPDMWLLAVDPGYSNSATHALAIACYLPEDGDNRLRVCDEWRYSGVESGVPRGFGWQVDHIWKWAKPLMGKASDVRVVVDAAESQFIKELAMLLAKKRSNWQLVTSPKGRVDDSIRAVHSLIDPDYGSMRIDGVRCPELVKEMRALMWREDAADRGRDKPTVGEDHGIAALRYASLVWEQYGPGRMMPHQVYQDADVTRLLEAVHPPGQ